MKEIVKMEENIYKPVYLNLSELCNRVGGIRKDEFSYKIKYLDDDETYSRYGKMALSVLKRACALPQIAERGLGGFEAVVRMSGNKSMLYCSISVCEFGEPEFLSLSFDLEGSCWMAVFHYAEFAEKTLDRLMDKLMSARFRFRAPLGAATMAAERAKR